MNKEQVIITKGMVLGAMLRELEQAQNKAVAQRAMLFRLLSCNYGKEYLDDANRMTAAIDAMEATMKHLRVAVDYGDEAEPC